MQFERGKINPHLPIWADLVTTWLENKYSAKIDTWNEAVGGWTTGNGKAAFAQKVMSKGAENIDLLVLGFGMNDIHTHRELYAELIEGMIDTYLTANPNGSVMLVSPMNPNTQTAWLEIGRAHV